MPSSGNVFDGVDYVVDVHPSDKLVETIATNGITSFSGEWKDASITVDVHPTTTLSKTYTENGTYSISGEFNGGSVTVAVSGGVDKPEESLVKTISSNGSFHYDPTPGSVFSGADITVDVHPTAKLSKTYTKNGTNTITGEFNGGSITINVHPTAKLSKTYTKNGTYNVSGEWKDATIKVNVPSTSTVTMTQAQYDALTVKDPNTIYLING